MQFPQLFSTHHVIHSLTANTSSLSDFQRIAFINALKSCLLTCVAFGASPSYDEFDGAINEVIPEGKTMLEKASLRLAWKRCQTAGQLAGPSVPDELPSSSAAASHSWSETFAPKLTQAVVSQLKNTFKSNYPAEVLLPENTPSLRLLSTIVHQKSKQDYKWVPWKFRLSMAKSDEITASKSSRLAKSEGLNLHAMLLDDPPAIEVSNGGAWACTRSDRCSRPFPLRWPWQRWLIYHH